MNFLSEFYIHAGSGVWISFQVSHVNICIASHEFIPWLSAIFSVFTKLMLWWGMFLEAAHWLGQIVCFASYHYVDSTLHPGSHASQPRITSRLVLVLILAISRCCHTLVEQPRTSLMPWFHPFMKLAQRLAKLFGIPWRSTRMFGPPAAQVLQSWYI